MSTNKRKPSGNTSSSYSRKKRPPAPDAEARETDVSLYLEYRNARYANRGVIGTRPILRPLTTYASDVVARNLTGYLNNEYALSKFDLLPPNLLFHILNTARQNAPTTLTPELLTKVFLDLAPTSLGALVLDDLPSATHKLVWESLSRSSHQIDNLGGVAPGLRVLSINHLEIRSKLLCSALATMPNLTSFDARGSVKLDDTVLTTLSTHCPNLSRVNVSMTAVSQVGIAKILAMKTLKVLKAASVKLGGDKFWMDFAASSKGSGCASLTNLKISSADRLTDKGLTALIEAVGSTLETLDVSTTRLSNMTTVLTPCIPSLRKLNLSLTDPQSISVLQELLSRLDEIGNLRKLALKRLFGSKRRHRLDQTTLDLLSPTFKNLTHLSLSQNEYIHDLSSIIIHAPNLEFLDVQNCDLTSRSFEAVENVDVPLGKLKTLDVSGTKVDEEVGRFLGRLKGLERIYLGNTRVTEVSVRQLVTCCLNLTVMDLNGCRGIPLRIRKTLFEDVWREVHGRG